jgi:hypothetical protein
VWLFLGKAICKLERGYRLLLVKLTTIEKYVDFAHKKCGFST